GHALRLIERRQFDVALLLGLLDSPLDVADRLGVLLDLGLIRRAELPAQAGPLFVDPIEEALLLLEARFAGGAAGAAAVAEQPLEDGARVVLHGQRLRRVA